MSSKDECAFVDTIQRLDRSCEMFHREMYGNGGSGMKDDIRALTEQLRLNTRLTFGVLGAMGATVATLVITKLF